MLMSLTYPVPKLSDPLDQESALTRAITGASVTGMDLAVQLLLKMRKDQAEATSHYTLQSAVLPESDSVDLAALPPQNREALALLRAWIAEPDDLGDAWWDEFERDLAQNRLRFHEIE